MDDPKPLVEDCPIVLDLLCEDWREVFRLAEERERATTAAEGPTLTGSSEWWQGDALLAQAAWALWPPGEKHYGFFGPPLSVMQLDLVGPGGAGATCSADTNGDGLVNVNDLTEVIIQWGACP